MSKDMSTCPIWEPNRIHLLIDPDKWQPTELRSAFSRVPSKLGSIIVGGTYTHSDRFEVTVDCCVNTGRPVGNMLTAGPLDSMLSKRANFLLVPILFNSASTRFVIEHLLMAAPVIRRYNLAVTSIAYLLLEGATITSTQYFTQCIPIPRDKPEILRTLGLVANYLGLSGIYLEAGSGAKNSATPEEVHAITESSSLPVLVGGGINSVDICRELFAAGATGLIVGTALEQRKNLDWLDEL